MDFTKLEEIEIDVVTLLNGFNHVVQADNVKPLESRYFRKFDRLLIPRVKNNLLFYFIVAHELGHKHNNKVLIWLFETFQLKAFYLLLEKDAIKKGERYVRKEYLALYREFSEFNFKSYL